MVDSNSSPSERSTPWWLWPNLLSLDAPVVALVWQEVFHRAFQIPLPFRLRMTLGVGVWVIYILDRCLDVWKMAPEHLNTARHQFYRQNWLPMLVLAVVSGALMLWRARAELRPVMFIAGIALGLLVLMYLFFVQKFKSLFQRMSVKEWLVGIIFAIGVTLNLWIRLQPRPIGFYLSFCLFAILCTVNCLIIHGWEMPGRPPQLIRIRWGILLLSLPILVGLVLFQSWIFLSLAASGVGLALLAWRGELLSQELRRVLVDAVFLTPLLTLIGS